jgi:hypothetical protein
MRVVLCDAVDVGEGRFPGGLVVSGAVTNLIASCHLTFRKKESLLCLNGEGVLVEMNKFRPRFQESSYF